MAPERLGTLIGAVAGTAFVLANTGSSPLPVALPLRALAVVALVVVVAAVGRNAGPVAEVQSEVPRSFWVIVGVEVLAIVLGCALLSGPLDRPEAAVAWIAFVVGGHFIGCARALDQPLFGWLGAALLLCGSGGLVLAWDRADVVAVDLVAGVLPGVVLLGFALVRQLRVR